jgi:hypothetical protein
MTAAGFGRPGDGGGMAGNRASRRRGGALFFPTMFDG